MKKYIFLLLICALLLAGCATKRKSDVSENFYLYEKNENVYHVYIKSYEKEYHRTFPKVLLQDIMYNGNWSDYEDFEGLFLYEYEDYEKYCERFHLEKKYDDKNSKYIIASGLWSNYVDERLVDVIIENNKATLYIMEESEESYVSTTADIDGCSFIIPVNKEIETVDYINVYTMEYLKEKLNPDYHNYNEYTTVDKPVIYLYPENEMKVSVKLDYNGQLTTTYPKYHDGWTVLAKPDGTLTDDKGQTYNYLYWEGVNNIEYDFSEGFCVKGEDTAEFLEISLEKLGLNRKEANEFIVYWLPKMENNEYNIISFQTDVYTDNAELDILPKPDTVIRVFMAYYPSDKEIAVNEQNLSSEDRNGFVVVEWGGCEVNR